MLERLLGWKKEFDAREYQKGQEAIANEMAAYEAQAQQGRIRQIGKVAGETIDQANELASDGDPDKQEIAAILKKAASEAVRRSAAGELPAGRTGLSEPDPFSDGSRSSATALPGSTPKALPHEPSEPPKKKRGRGRPKKNEKD